MKKIILTIICFLALAGSAHATTYYVSKSTANGWASGSDANNGLATSTPKLTINGAHSAASATDTIIVNDGTYTENGGSGFLSISKGVTINPLNNGMVTIKAASSNRVLNVAVSTGTLTLGDLLLSGEGARLWGIYSSNVANLVLNGTDVDGATSDSIHIDDQTTNLTMTDNTITGTTTAQSAVYFTGLNAGTVLIDDVNINLPALNTTIGPIAIIATSTDPVMNPPVIDATVKNSVITSSNSGAGFGIRMENFDGAVIEDNVITSDGSGSVTDIIVYSSRAYHTAHNPIIRDNFIFHNGDNGLTILHGTNATGQLGDNLHNYGEIYGNTIIGESDNTTLHGIMLGNNLGGRVWGNKVYNVNLGLLAKLNNGGVFSGNEVFGLNGAGHGLRSKGSTNTVFTNNGVYLNGSTDVGMYADSDPGIPTHSTGVEFTNNNIYVGAGRFANVDASNTATFSNNNYYKTSALASNQWTYQGTDYDTLVEWQAVEASALYQDPQVWDPESSFRPQNWSPLYHAGTTATSTALDFNGNSFHNPATIGPYEMFLPSVRSAMRSMIDRFTSSPRSPSRSGSRY